MAAGLRMYQPSMDHLTILPISSDPAYSEKPRVSSTQRRNVTETHCTLQAACHHAGYSALSTGVV